jgi:hypothetical protein
MEILAEIVLFEDSKLENFYLWDGGENFLQRGLGMETVFHPPPRGDSVPENY